MKQFYILKQVSVLLVMLVCQTISAQVELRQLSGFGTTLYDINNDGSAIYGNGYYDFTTESSSQTEAGVSQTIAINNAGQVLGAILNDAGEVLQPAMRVDGVWALLNNFDPAYTYTLSAMSENGVYVVGQTGYDPITGAWGFIYNTQTETLTILSSPLYEYGAAYGVNDAGIAVGWVDDLPEGTVRQPCYFDEEGNITLISENYGEAYAINNSNVIVGNLDGATFTFDMASTTLSTFAVPDGYNSSSFLNISETGVVVGYAQTFIPGEGDLRNPLIYHPDLNAQPQFLTDVLTANGVDASTLNGQASSISPDGNFIAGWTSGPAFAADGWAVNFDDLLLSVSDASTIAFSVYPNPVVDVIHFNSQTPIKNITVYNVAGQKVLEASNIFNNQLNVSSLTNGMYVFNITLDTGAVQRVKILKK